MPDRGLDARDRTGVAIQRAVDFVEQHLGTELTVAAIAQSAHLSAYHFARLFRAQTGIPPLAYVRARRMTESVKALKNGNLAVHEIALTLGFSSQQAFTVAFTQRFAVPPATFRAAPFTVHLQEKLDMSQRFQHIPRGPEFRERPAFTAAGYTMRCNEKTKTKIPGLWQRFAPKIGSVPGQAGHVTYGICYDGNQETGEFTYMAGVATHSAEDCEGFEVCEVPAGRYAVFTHEGSLAHIQETVGYIFGEWLPASSYELAGSPDFELYDERFDPVKDEGELEYWVPIR